MQRARPDSAYLPSSDGDEEAAAQRAREPLPQAQLKPLLRLPFPPQQLQLPRLRLLSLLRFHRWCLSIRLQQYTLALPALQSPLQMPSPLTLALE